MNEVDIKEPDYLDQMEKFEKTKAEIQNIVKKYHLNMDTIFNVNKLLFEESNYYIKNIVD